MKTLFIFVAIFCERISATARKSRFIKLKQDTIIEDAASSHKVNVSSQIECFLLGQQHKAYLVQTTIKGDFFLCSLFPFIEDVSSKMRLSNGSEVYKTDIRVQKDCLDWRRHGYEHNGVYPIGVEGNPIVWVSCDMKSQGGGWIVFQNRFDGSVNFNQDWNTYKRGFGRLQGEFWLGNDVIHLLSTRSQNTELLLSAKGFNGDEIFAQFEGFAVGDEQHGYVLTSGKATKGLAQNAWLNHNGSKFSTRNVDNDAKKNGKCKEGNGWWLKNCWKISLNGNYGHRWLAKSGIHWSGWKGWGESLKETKMMMRPK